ncbi:MAG: carbon-nitrogen hydrolase family protein [Gammaproteobacteria bacterium]
MNDSITVGLAQIAPVWLDRNRTLDKVIDWVEQAADEGCQLVAFGETLVPGYPFWLSSTDGAQFDSDVQKEIHAHYLDQAVCIEAGHLDALCEVAADREIEVMVGCYERPQDRGGHTGYCSLIRVDRYGNVRNSHRKLMPTYEERLSWGTGDGHGLRVFELGPFTVGGLNCWENWMPLARSALYAQGEDLHVAVWPGAQRNTIDSTRFIAFESRSWVLSVSGLMRHEDIPDDMPARDEIIKNTPRLMSDGGSCIAAPDGAWLIEPVVGAEELLVATVDHETVRRERQNFDPFGHYSRPDVLQLKVNRARQTGVDFTDEDEGV